MAKHYENDKYFPALSHMMIKDQAASFLDDSKCVEDEPFYLSKCFPEWKFRSLCTLSYTNNYSWMKREMHGIEAPTQFISTNGRFNDMGRHDIRLALSSGHG